MLILQSEKLKICMVPFSNTSFSMQKILNRKKPMRGQSKRWSQYLWKRTDMEVERKDLTRGRRYCKGEIVKQRLHISIFTTNWCCLKTLSELQDLLSGPRCLLDCWSPLQSQCVYSVFTWVENLKCFCQNTHQEIPSEKQKLIPVNTNWPIR